MYNFGRELKAYLNNGHYELESHDFAHENSVRIFAFDNGILSFEDVQVDDKPKILITNPKDCRYMSELEPFHKMGGGQIRFLIFSKKDFSKLSVFIDNKPMKGVVEKLQSSVFQLKWDSQFYLQGIHEIRIEMTIDGEKTIKIQQFSLDGSIPSLSWSHIIGRLVLLTNWPFVFRFFYFSFHFFLIFSLIFKLGNINNMRKEIYYFFLFYSIYLLFGPWIFIEISDNVFGAIFTTGILRLDSFEFIPNVDLINSFTIWHLYFSFSVILLYFIYEKKFSYFFKIVFFLYLVTRIRSFWYYITRNSLSLKSIQISIFSPCGLIFYAFILYFSIKNFK
jgi:hypothetical protein